MIVFLDLDNTLIYSSQLDSRDDSAVLIDHGYREEYWTFLKEGTLDFLQELRNKYQVKMLTAADCTYARKINDVFKLGFDKQDIYARVNQFTYVPSEFLRQSAVLIDDNDPNDSYAINKIRWIKSFSDKFEYIQAPRYLGTGYFKRSWVTETMRKIDALTFTTS